MSTRQVELSQSPPAPSPEPVPVMAVLTLCSTCFSLHISHVLCDHKKDRIRAYWRNQSAGRSHQVVCGGAPTLYGGGGGADLKPRLTNEGEGVGEPYLDRFKSLSVASPCYLDFSLCCHLKLGVHLLRLHRPMEASALP